MNDNPGRARYTKFYVSCGALRFLIQSDDILFALTSFATWAARGERPAWLGDSIVTSLRGFCDPELRPQDLSQSEKNRISIVSTSSIIGSHRNE